VRILTPGVCFQCGSRAFGDERCAAIREQTAVDVPHHTSGLESGPCASNGDEFQPRRIRVIIADDYPAFSHALQRVIDAEPDMTVIAAPGDGATALEAIRQLAPDVAVLDMRMPGLDGIDVARRLFVEDRLPARTVLVTLYWDRVVFERAIEAGVSGYVPKDTALSEIVNAVRAVARGETYVSCVLADGPAGL
jgi:DNA-binding NarL/FixJ family response regulator